MTHKVTKFFMRIFNFFLSSSKIVIDLIAAVKSLTLAVRDLTKAYQLLAKMQIEDREAIAELYGIVGVQVLEDLPPAKLPEKKAPTADVAELEKKRKQMN